jgi:hypothetical protein
MFAMYAVTVSFNFISFTTFCGFCLSQPARSEGKNTHTAERPAACALICGNKAVDLYPRFKTHAGGRSAPLYMCFHPKPSCSAPFRSNFSHSSTSHRYTHHPVILFLISCPSACILIFFLPSLMSPFFVCGPNISSFGL